MIRDYLQFLRNVLEIIHFIRGIILMHVFMLLVCAVLFVFVEDLSVGRAVYLVMITALTIGYGDVTPATVLGKTICIAVGVIGILITGIVVAVVVRALTDSILEQRQEKDATK